MKRPLKVLSVFGTRPEAIKLSPVIRRLAADPQRYASRTCVTAQHRQMLDRVLAVFDIKPDHDLSIMAPDQDLFHVTNAALLGLRTVLGVEQPGLVLVQGDTTTTFVASLAASYLQIPVGHVEAGLRTHDRCHPFPEETNRRLTTHLAELHFAPTARARENLLREGIEASKIHVTGNTVIDALFMVVRKQVASDVQEHWRRYFRERYALAPAEGKTILVTGHRRESFGPGLREICAALGEIARRNPEVHLVYPVHPNPNVQQPVREILDGWPNLHLIEPLDYEPFVYLMSHCYLILTDSGGVQEEAPALGKPVLVMRSVTERPEAVEAGTAILVGTDRQRIVEQTERLLNDHETYASMSRASSPYGDGKAAQRIAEAIEEAFGR